MATKRKSKQSPGPCSASKKPKHPVAEEESLSESTETADKILESSQTANFKQSTTVSSSKTKKLKQSKETVASCLTNDAADEDEQTSEARFLGDPIEPEEARRRWPHRYAAPPKQVNSWQRMSEYNVGRSKNNACPLIQVK